MALIKIRLHNTTIENNFGFRFYSLPVHYMQKDVADNCCKAYCGKFKEAIMTHMLTILARLPGYKDAYNNHVCNCYKKV